MTDEVPEWFTRHLEANDIEHDNARKERAELRERLDKMVTKQDLEDTVDKMFHKYLLTSGGKIKTFVLTTALIMGSLVAIFAGFKTMLAWLGIMITRG